MARQRTSFRDGYPAPDFPGGAGESNHVGRPTEEDVRKFASPEGLQSLGLSKLVSKEGATPGAVEAVSKANKALGFE